MKDVLKKLLLLAGSLVVAVLAIEICLRLTTRDPLVRWGDGRASLLVLSDDDRLRYELRPNLSARAWNTDVTTNGAGFRGIEGSVGKHSGFRAVVLGDSIAFGNGMDVEATFPWKLHHRLRRSVPDAEVLNLAIGGYDTLQEVALFELRGRGYRPDLVVVAFCLNDVGVASPNLEFTERTRVRRSNPLLRSRTVQFVIERVDRLRFEAWWEHVNELETFREVYREQIDVIGDDESTLLSWMRDAPDVYPSSWYGDAERVGRLRHAFRTLQQMSEEDGFDVVVAIIPWLVGRPGAYPHELAHRIVEHEAARARFDVIDFSEPFLERGATTLRRSPGDPTHPSEAGHTILANGLAAYIASPESPRSEH